VRSRFDFRGGVHAPAGQAERRIPAATMDRMTERIRIDAAAELDLPQLIGLFEAYRGFYGRAPDRDATRAFVRERIATRDTRFFLARERTTIVGFVHLQPFLDTLELRPMWVLEDIFVRPESRRLGVGAALMRHAESHARATGAHRMLLSTAWDNATAQRLYQAHGWHRDLTFWHYEKVVA